MIPYLTDYSFKIISNYKRSLKTAFYTAIQDECIRKNPFDFHINTVIEDDTEPKIPLSPIQEESLLSFVKRDKVYHKYYDELIILLGTGLRISELCGLTDRDIDFDFENRTINVNDEVFPDWDAVEGLNAPTGARCLLARASLRTVSTSQSPMSSRCRAALGRSSMETLSLRRPRPSCRVFLL